MTTKKSNGKGNYTVTIPTKTEVVAVLIDGKQKLDEDGDPIMETKVLESISCELNVTFEDLKRANGQMIKYDKKGNFLGMDMVSPGESLLMYSGIQDENWKKITSDPMLKMAAATALFSVVQELKVADIKKN